MELEDLRDRRFYWAARSARPLDCRIYEDTRQVGCLFHGAVTGTVQAHPAGLDWTIRTVYRNRRLVDQVSFDGGPVSVAEAWGETDVHGTPSYVLAIDEVEIYRIPHSDRRDNGWFDERARLAVGVRNVRSRWEAGEIGVLPHVVLPHAPILVLMAAYQDGRRHLFSPA